MTGIAWRLGVDYGSSHTVAVLSRPGGETPRPLTFDGSPLLSSAIYAEPDGTLLTGQDAHAAARSSRRGTSRTRSARSTRAPCCSATARCPSPRRSPRRCAAWPRRPPG
ncbi:hypothetical protein [Dactylosporangium darangshiense]|uniref:hypothetical protein n=1 Tax=Dactylosporangium darangshiense TaxID=579108 RepID=UPI0036405708